MKFFSRTKKIKMNKKDRKAEELFNKGEIILPTDIRDYEDLESFREKTSHIPEIKNKLNRLGF